MPTFTTLFAPPAPPGGFEIEADLDASRVRLSWLASSIPQVDFRGFRVSRSVDNGITFEEIAMLPVVTDVSHDDYDAPLNTPLVYRLTQSNLDFESEPVEGSVSLESARWQVVVPGNSGLTFSVPKLRSASLTSPKTQDVFSPIGRPGKIAVGDVVQAEDGAISFLALPDNLGMAALLRAIQGHMEGGVILKATDGSVWEVQFGDMTRSFNDYGGQEITIPFHGVG